MKSDQPNTKNAGSLGVRKKPQVQIRIPETGEIIEVPRASAANIDLMSRMKACEQIAFDASLMINKMDEAVEGLEGEELLKVQRSQEHQKLMRDIAAAEYDATKLAAEIVNECATEEAAACVTPEIALPVVQAMYGGKSTLPDEMRPDFTLPERAQEQSDDQSE